MAYRRAAAEFIGTFVLVFGGVGSAVIAGEAIGNLGIAFAFGLSLLAMAYAIGPIRAATSIPRRQSGSCSPRGSRSTWRSATGSPRSKVRFVAALVLFIVIKARAGGYGVTDKGFGANGYGEHSPDGFPLGAALLVEIVLTFFLVFTVLAATDRIANAAFAGIPIGLVLTLIHLVGIPVTNLSFTRPGAAARRSSSGTGPSPRCGCSSSPCRSARRWPASCTHSCSPERRRSTRSSPPSRPRTRRRAPRHVGPPGTEGRSAA